MPILNSKKSSVSNTNSINARIAPLRKEIQQLNLAIGKLRAEMKKQKIEQELDNEFKKKFATFISYNPNDKKRLNIISKDIILIKKQLNLSKTSAIMKKLNRLMERVDNIENNLVSENELTEEENI
jgi:ABC-type phosphate transport system auxiliary subunit